MKNVHVFALLAFAVGLLFSCTSNVKSAKDVLGQLGSSSSNMESSSSSVPSSSSVFVASNCDGFVGATVIIGSQTWMKSNLNCNASGSKCYGNDDSNCAKYGRLYDWATAMTVCPSGWHIPSNADWDKLYRFADGTSGTSSPYDSPTAGKYLKATSGWNSGGNGTDAYGFSALPGGFGLSGGSFDSVGNYGHWWSSSEYDAASAYRRGMIYRNEIAYWDYGDKGYLFSVRCVKD